MGKYYPHPGDPPKWVYQELESYLSTPVHFEWHPTRGIWYLQFTKNSRRLTFKKSGGSTLFQPKYEDDIETLALREEIDGKERPLPFARGSHFDRRLFDWLAERDIHRAGGGRKFVEREKEKFAKHKKNEKEKDDAEITEASEEIVKDVWDGRAPSTDVYIIPDEVKTKEGA